LNYESKVKSRVRSGEFANASEYVRHGIRVAEAVHISHDSPTACSRRRQSAHSLRIEAGAD